MENKENPKNDIGQTIATIIAVGALIYALYVFLTI